MRSDTIAVVVSLFSLVVAALSLGWNIYRDVVLRARLRVSFGFRDLIGGGPTLPERMILLSVVNMGPGITRPSMIQWRKTGILTRILGKSLQGVLLNPAPMSSKLPCTLDTGEEADFLFNLTPECILARGITDIGMRDSFGRVHWAPRKQVREAVDAYEKHHRVTEQADPSVPQDHQH